MDTVVIATDSVEIENAVTAFNFSKLKVYRRLAENARDVSSTEDVMLEYLDRCKNDYDKDAIFILVQATTPFTETKHFTEAINLYNTHKYDSLMSCVRSKHFYGMKMAHH